MAEYYDPETYPTEWNYLQPGTIIDQYMIERELAHGGFSSVYLARQMADQVQVAIKEYLPRKLSHRTWNNVVVANNEEANKLFLRGRKLFFDEAKVLASLKHPNIVEVTNFFQENSTVYMVMTYDYGVTLDRILKDKMLDIDEAFITKVFGALLKGVQMIHKHQLVHLDIKPANILIRPEHDPLLLDFGGIQSFTQQNKQKQNQILSHGFSPIEQYHQKGQLGPWTDIYAIGASMRACLDYKPPQASPERVKQDLLQPVAKQYKRKFSPALLQAIDWSMQIKASERPQSIEEFELALGY